MTVSKGAGATVSPDVAESPVSNAEKTEAGHAKYETSRQTGNDAIKACLAGRPAALRLGSADNGNDLRRIGTHIVRLGHKAIIGIEDRLPSARGRFEGIEGIAHARFEFAIVHERASFSVFLPRAIQE